MSELFQPLVASLKAARKRLGLSQRALSDAAGVPQSHISKIEAGEVDLRLSSLIALGRVLELELVLIPKQHMPAVQTITHSNMSDLKNHGLTEVQLPAYRLDDHDKDEFS